MKDETFRIRAYGKSELAMLYFPHMSQQSAMRALNRWIKINPRLAKMETKNNHYFTPRQVKKMVDEWGEPFEPADLKS